mmetsp:Transcript_3838/g.7653  ORF Transcript_3838/g.7653 Transcript_3838/m.7653 type:complete len:288 (-) Transcript_3838:706-1569(-)
MDSSFFSVSASSPSFFSSAAFSAAAFSAAAFSAAAFSSAAFFSASAFFLSSRSAFFFSLSAFFFARSISVCFLSASRRLFSSIFFALNSMSAVACFCFNTNSLVRFLNSEVGSPINTMETFLKPLELNFASISCLSCLIKPLFNSMQTKFLACNGATDRKTRWILPSSSSGMPNVNSGLSFELLIAYPRDRQMPLRSAQLRIIWSLSSAYPGFLSWNILSHSNTPSSGRPTGKTTSYLPSLAGGLYSVMVASFAEASATMRQVKGRGVIGSFPRFTCRAMHFHEIVG